MPKLGPKVMERNQERIERAALRLFTRQGFHGTSVREIADAAGVSLGNLYNYFPNKESVFRSLVRRYAARMAELQRQTVRPLLWRFDPESLRELAAGVRRIVYSHPDYWRLMYIDVTEFGNRHFAHIFRRLAKNLAAIADTPARGAAVRGVINPEVAFATIYMHFFTYYLVEKLFGGKQHLGLPEPDAIEQLIRIFTGGIGAMCGRDEPRC